jgi:hypothetical protein
VGSIIFFINCKICIVVYIHYFIYRNMESILPSEAKGNVSREDSGELLQPVFDQLMDLHNTILPDGRSKLSANFGLTLCLNNADHISQIIFCFFCRTMGPRAAVIPTYNFLNLKKKRHDYMKNRRISMNIYLHSVRLNLVNSENSAQRLNQNRRRRNILR